MKRISIQLLLLMIVVGCHMEIPDPPVAKFTFTPIDGCQAPCKVTFMSNSENATSLEWDFDDGKEASPGAATVTYEFSDGKDYYVKLIAKNADGGSDGVTQKVSIKARAASLPEANFKVTLDKEGIAPSTASFQNLSKNAKTYAWNFGDSLNATTENPNETVEQSPKHTYIKPGKYTVSLISYNADNVGSKPSVQVVEIKAVGPVADFKITDDNCTAPCKVTFTDSSKNAKTYLWDFGDGNTSTDPSPEHTYDKDGTYEVTLTVTGDGGTAVKKQTVTIKKAEVNAVSISGDFNFPTDMIADGASNIYVSGTAKGTINFGNGKVITSNASSEDFFVAKYSPTGDCLWAYLNGSSADDHGNGITLDNNNDVYLTGFVNGIPTNSGITYRKGKDGFVVKLSGSDGQMKWFKSFGGQSDDEGKDVGFFQTPEGPRIYLAGTVTGELNSSKLFFDSYIFSSDGQDIAFTFIDAADGEFGQPTILGGANAQTVESMVLDDEGSAYLTGSFDQTLDMAGRTKILKTAGSSDAFVAKWVLDPGYFLWARQAGSPNNDYGYDIAVDNSKNVYFTGTYIGPLDPLGVGSRGDVNVFLGRWNADGGAIPWGRSGFNNGNNDFAGGVAISATGNVLLSGSYPGTGYFPFDSKNSFESQGSTDIIIAEVKPNDGLATEEFQVTAGGRGEERGVKICVAADGHIYSTGWFNGSAVFNGTTLTGNAGQRNTYIVKYKR
jgi:PKD repeat protein